MFERIEQVLNLRPGLVAVKFGCPFARHLSKVRGARQVPEVGVAELLGTQANADLVHCQGSQLRKHEVYWKVLIAKKAFVRNVETSQEAWRVFSINQSPISTRKGA